jgi:hypothetical protein
MKMMVEEFNAKGLKSAAGLPVRIVLYNTTSLFRSDLKPAIYSPSNMLWISNTNKDWNSTNGALLVPNPQSSCVYTTRLPAGIAMWKSRARVLGWPREPISWRNISELALDPNGWGKYGYPEWGKFRFAHAHPQVQSVIPYVTNRAHVVCQLWTALSYCFYSIIFRNFS